MINLQPELFFESEAAKTARNALSGLRTTTRMTKGVAASIEAALGQSTALGAVLRPTLQRAPLSKHLRIYSFEQEFDHAYTKTKKLVLVFGSREEKALRNVRSFYHEPTDTIHLRPSANIGQALPLILFKLSSVGFRKFFGPAVTQGVALYFANLVLAEHGSSAIRSELPPRFLECAEDLAILTSQARLAQAYFQNHAALLEHLMSKLSIGPVQADELRNDALTKTKLLATARFASYHLSNMVSVGITGPKWARLWMRSDVAGAHELQITGGKAGTKTVSVDITRDADQTAAITYGASPGETPLEPLTRYRFRVVRKSDQTPLGEGSFETAPANDAATPQKVTIALLSCHQPFSDRGGIIPESARMLRLLPRILQENDVKFVLPCGDQIYADDPSPFSLFSNEYLLRQVIPAKRIEQLELAPGDSQLLKCNEAEVRRVYQQRYRTFWSSVHFRKMYANYPCYPAMDDHEIRGDWGSLPEHATPAYDALKQGALAAFHDYQTQSVLPTRRPPGSFHYDFSYGNIGVFVMDIRSTRSAGGRKAQLFGPTQANDFRQFLANNAHKKVLFIVTSVPVVHLSRWITQQGVKHASHLGDFPDHWSTDENLPARDAFLSALHAHQQAHPQQRVAILSGDVHIGNAFVLKWRGGNKPRLYQFTSSPVSVKFFGSVAKLTTYGPKLVRGIDAKSTPFGGACSGEAHLLEAAQGARSQNPLVGMNVGLIEIQRSGDVSNIKFKLVGYNPKDPNDDRPYTHFESGWLG